MCVYVYPLIQKKNCALSALHLRCCAADRYNNNNNMQQAAPHGCSSESATLLSPLSPRALFALCLSLSASSPVVRLSQGFVSFAQRSAAQHSITPQRSSLRSRRFSFFSLWSTLFAERGNTSRTSRVQQQQQ